MLTPIELSLFFNNIAYNLKEKYLDIWDGNIEEKLHTEISGYHESLACKIRVDSPYIQNRFDLARAERDQRHFGGSESTIRDDLSNYRKLSPGLDGSFWLEKIRLLEGLSNNCVDDERASSEYQKIVANIQHPIRQQYTAIRRNLQESWRRDYEKFALEWELSEIEKFQREVLKKYYDWFDKIGEISKTLNTLGLETRLLWDLSTGSLFDQDISQLLKWAEYLRSNEDIIKLCDLMGKLNKESHSHEVIKQQATCQYEIQKYDINSRQEIIGIKLGNCLDNLVPQELSYLTDSDISILFDLKYVENRLMCFEKKGTIMDIEESIKEQAIEVDIIDERGPIIICVDTSGSMSGAPEIIAKAITLLLSTQAVNQKRACYLINFSTDIVTFDFQRTKGIDDLINFLKMNFHGGTDAAPALHEAVRKISSEKYSRADVLMISDFLFTIKDDKLREIILDQKLQENCFYSLSIGKIRLKEIDNIFDRQWIYDASLGTISELNNVVEWLSKERLNKLPN